MILAGTEGDVAAAMATGDHVLGLTPRALDSLRQGPVIPVAQLDWQEYQSHERGQAPGCEECAPAATSLPLSPSAVYRPPSRWTHFILLAVLVAVAVGLGLLLAPSAGAR